MAIRYLRSCYFLDSSWLLLCVSPDSLTSALPGSTWSLSGMAKQMVWHSAWPCFLIFLFYALYPFNPAREKEGRIAELRLQGYCNHDWSRIIKLHGSESQICASSKLDQELFIPQIFGVIGSIGLSIQIDYPVGFWLFAYFSLQAVFQDQKSFWPIVLLTKVIKSLSAHCCQCWHHTRTVKQILHLHRSCSAHARQCQHESAAARSISRQPQL